jgi:hypothetical protein
MERIKELFKKENLNATIRSAFRLFAIVLLIKLAFFDRTKVITEFQPGENQDLIIIRHKIVGKLQEDSILIYKYEKADSTIGHLTDEQLDSIIARYQRQRNSQQI